MQGSDPEEELMQRLGRRAASWLASQGLLRLLSYTAQDYLRGVGGVEEGGSPTSTPPHRGLSPPPPLIKKVSYRLAYGHSR